MTMETKNVFKSMMLAACCLGSVVLASCSKDDDNNPGLRFSAAKVEVAQGATATVKITSGTQPFTAKSSDDKLATVKVDKNMMTVTGVKAGKGTIMVTDKNKQMGSIPFTVVAPLSFDKMTVTVGIGKEEVVMVKSGTAPYTATVKDSKIATVSVKDAKVTVKGVKAGSTTVTVIDKNKTAGIITVTVK
jgi:hypothetical protein